MQTSEYYYLDILTLKDRTPFIDWSYDIAYNEEETFSMQRCLIGSQIAKYIKIQPFLTCYNQLARRKLLPARDTLTTTLKTQEVVMDAKFMPSDPRNFAAISNVGEVALYSLKEDRYIYGALPKYSKRTLKYKTDRSMAGYVLRWHPMELSTLLSATYDGGIVVHDIETGSAKNSFISYLHQPIDGSWAHYEPYSFGTIGADCKFYIWDTRNPGPCSTGIAHNKFANAIDFSPHIPWLFLTGGDFAPNIIWDIRYTARELNYIRENVSPVLRTKWSSEQSGLFASCAYGGEAFIGKFSIDGELKVVFQHKLHNSIVTDIKWHPTWNLVTSVDMRKEIHFWQPKI